MAEQNKQDNIKIYRDTNPSKHIVGKAVAISFMALDTLALITFFVCIAINDYGHMTLFSFGNGNKDARTSEPTTQLGYSTPEWVVQAENTENKLLHHVNYQLSKQGYEACYELVSVTYEQIGQSLYNFNIAASTGSKLYKLAITELSATQDIQSYVIDMPDSSFNEYAYTLSYTDIVLVNKNETSKMYYSKGPDNKELMSGYYYDDHMFFVYMEHEKVTLPANEDANQIYKHGSLIEDYYYYVKDVKGE